MRTANIEGTELTGTQKIASGSIVVTTTGGGVGPIPGDQTILKPDSVIVEDYRGADGLGDQGGYVMVSFKNTPQHGELSGYRVWRFIQVTVVLDTTGKLKENTTSVGEWVPWASIDAIPPLGAQQPVTRAVIPALDNKPTRWAVTAEKGGKASDATATAAKVVFSAESVKETLALLGIQSVMPVDEVLKVFGPSYDYTKSILGDRKDLVLGRLDLDALRKIAMRVPDGILAATSPIRASDATISAEAVRAVDNIPPAAVTGDQASNVDRKVTLKWTASVDDKVVGFIAYRGYSTPIPGVKSYDVLRGAEEESLVKVASLPSGSTTFEDVVSPDLGDKLFYRIVATDLDNTTPGQLLTVTFVVKPPGRVKYIAADGSAVYVVLSPTDPDYSLTPGFPDFFAFAGSFGLTPGQDGFLLQADTDDDGDVDFDDFFNFADSFGKDADPTKTIGGAKIATKLVGAPVLGVNRDAGLDLKLASEKVLAGQPIELDVAVSNAASLKGYGFTLTYDPQKFELVEVSPGEQNMLAKGGSTPVFFQKTEPGRVEVANAITGQGIVSGAGSVAHLVFNVLGEIDDIVRIEIADGILVDGSQLLNPVVTLGALDIQTTPTEFALWQNFPNPFNPETTIKYDLADGSQVQLRIYNLVGQVVRTLVGERQAAGRYAIRWDGRDDRGLSVSSGIYFYSLSTEKFRAVNKLMLLK